MLTAKGADEDKVRGLRSGADDYVTPVGGLSDRQRAQLIELPSR